MKRVSVSAQKPIAAAITSTWANPTIILTPWLLAITFSIPTRAFYVWMHRTRYSECIKVVLFEKFVTYIKGLDCSFFQILTLNKTAQEMLGYHADDEISLYFNDIVHKERGMDAVEELECLAEARCLVINGRVVGIQIIMYLKYSVFSIWYIKLKITRLLNYFC